MPPIDKVSRGNREDKCPGRSQRVEKIISRYQIALILKTWVALSKYTKWERNSFSFYTLFNLISLLFPQTISDEMASIYQGCIFHVWYTNHSFFYLFWTLLIDAHHFTIWLKVTDFGLVWSHMNRLGLKEIF